MCVMCCVATHTHRERERENGTHGLFKGLMANVCPWAQKDQRERERERESNTLLLCLTSPEERKRRERERKRKRERELLPGVHPVLVKSSVQMEPPIVTWPVLNAKPDVTKKRKVNKTKEEGTSVRVSVSTCVKSSVSCYSLIANFACILLLYDLCSHIHSYTESGMRSVCEGEREETKKWIRTWANDSDEWRVERIGLRECHVK